MIEFSGEHHVLPCSQIIVNIGIFGYNPMDCRALMVSCSISWPKMVAVPEVGLDTPVKIRMVVVLPAPLGPKKPKVSPSPTEKLISLTAMREPNFLLRWDIQLLAYMYQLKYIF
jgi:hypothetical protein